MEVDPFEGEQRSTLPELQAELTRLDRQRFYVLGLMAVEERMQAQLTIEDVRHPSTDVQEA